MCTGVKIKPVDSLAVNVFPVPTGAEMGGSSDVGDVSWQIPTMSAVFVVPGRGISHPISGPAPLATA
jgi:metal-dependent amidase/aminoacylase/carboxypeptidase family protein